jgi:MoxR-like ATPase
MAAKNSLVEALKALQDIPEESIVAAAMREDRTATSKMVVAAIPSPTLVNRYKPDFVLGYEIDVESIKDALINGQNILVVGDKGGGKSSFMFYLVDELNEPTRVLNRKIYASNGELLKKGKKEAELKPYFALPYPIAHLGCGSGTRIDSLIGTVALKTTASGREVITIYGAVVDAWINGKILIIDELDMASPDVWGELHQFFDGETNETTIYVNGPEVIRKNPKFRVLATANTFGLGEDQVNFAGTQLLNGALLDRFNYKVKFPYLKTDNEVEAILKKYPKARRDALAKMVLVADKIRSAKFAGVVAETLSTRKLMAWACECVARETRMKARGIGVSPLSLKDYWDNIVVPAAEPAYLCGNPDEAVVRTYLEIR